MLTFRDADNAILHERLVAVAIVVLLCTCEDWGVRYFGIWLNLNIAADAFRWGHQGVAAAFR